MTLIEPNCGLWGPDPTPKEGKIWGYFLDFSLNPKLDQFYWSSPILLVIPTQFWIPRAHLNLILDLGAPLDLNQPYGVVLGYVQFVI